MRDGKSVSTRVSRQLAVLGLATVCLAWGGAANSAQGAPIPALGLKLWLQADSLNLTEGQAVSLWADQSGNGLDVSQADAAHQPTYNASGINGHPTVRFDGWDDVLIRANVPGSQITGATAITIFLVQNQNPANLHNTALDWGPVENRVEVRTAYELGEYGQEYVGVHGLMMWHGDTGSLQGWFAAADWFNGDPKVVEFSRAGVGTTGACFVDGADMGGARPYEDTINLAAASPLFVGADAGDYNNFLGDIAEVIVYDRALESADRALVYSYLADKYAPATAPEPGTLGLLAVAALGLLGRRGKRRATVVR